ncbi:DNA topoisomerase 4 subunit A [Nymphon striatum]|nr:DNA topoisomerase 4 subunit A [Nymphon striatum]
MKFLAISNPKAKKDKKTIDQDQLLLKQSALAMIDTVKSEGQKDVRLIIEPKTSRVSADEMMAFLLLTYQPRSLLFSEYGDDWYGWSPSAKEHADGVARMEGRMIAFLNIDEVIKVIRNSDEPKQDLIAAFDLTDIQAEDILEIRLRQLARLEGIKIEKELEKLREEAKGLDAILGMTILLSTNGWIRARQGHSVDRDTVNWKAGDSELAIIETRTVRPVVILDSNGRCYAFDASSVPGGKGDGIPVSSIIELQNGASITAALSGDEEDKYLFTSSNSYGFIASIKRFNCKAKSRLDEINEYPNGGRGVKIMDIPKSETLTSVALSDGEMTTVIVKGKEKAIKGDCRSGKTSGVVDLIVNTQAEVKAFKVDEAGVMVSLVGTGMVYLTKQWLADEPLQFVSRAKRNLLFKLDD